jgi:TolB-like protein
VTPGAFYADEIVHAIDAAKAIVLILSQNAAKSQHVLREVERAASKGYPVFSLRVDQAPLPAGLEYFLNTSQWLDASDGEMARSMPKLIVAVRAAIQAPVVTPETVPIPRALAPSSSARPPQRSAIIVASLIVLGIAGFAVDRLWVSGRRAAQTSAPTAAVPEGVPASVAPSIPEKSVAVSPFVDLSEKHNQEYFADGIAEQVLELLARIPGLKVIGRTSSFRFKGSTLDVRSIGKTLGVAHLLEGSVQRAGDTVRVTAQLISATDGSNEWSDTYESRFDDVLKVQDAIASGLARALQIAVGDVQIRERNSVPRRARRKSVIPFLGLNCDQFAPDSRCFSAPNPSASATKTAPIAQRWLNQSVSIRAFCGSNCEYAMETASPAANRTIDCCDELTTRCTRPFASENSNIGYTCLACGRSNPTTIP